MLNKLADAGIRRPRSFALLALVLLLICGVVGGRAPGILRAPNAFEDPGSQAASARTQLERASGAQPAAGVLALVHVPPLSAKAAAVARTLAGDPDVALVQDYASSREQSFVSRDRRSSVIAASLRAGVEPEAAVKRIERALAGDRGVLLGGGDVALAQIEQQSSQDLALAELLVFPLLALLALWIFRGIAALLPLLVGVLSVLGTFTVLVAIDRVFPISIFALNLVFGLGFGLAVDYSLFLVSRFREELGRGVEVPDAVRRTIRTAGRTVVFSALIVAAAGASLTIFPLRFLQSIGLGGAIVALLAAAVSLVFLPAAFVLLGQRIGRYVPPPAHEGRWYRLAQTVMRRPAIVAALTAGALILVATPSLGVRWTGVDASILPASKSARVVNDRLAAEFPNVNATPIVLAITAPPTAGRQVSAYTRDAARVAGVATVTRPRYAGANTWELQASTRDEPIGATAQRAVQVLRRLPAPFRVAVGGEAAEFHDLQAAIGYHLPLAIAILVVTALLVLWLMTGSVILPVKALAMTALSVGVATGMLVLVFQDGRLTGLLSYRPQGAIESADFLVLVAIAFALSTDYGVFLLTRIKEAHDSGIEDRAAIALGLQRTGPIITAAAILLTVAIGAFLTSRLVFLQELGLGAVVALLVDAFLIRALLVPALMCLLGRWNWWQPAPLARLHERIGVHEQAVLA
jgi:uncharacterized membrane protein YdfJ with MMPL/SSD domain